MTQNDEVFLTTEKMAMLVYLLLLIVPLLPFTPLLAVIIAYVYRDDAPEWLQSHFQLQVRTFWIALLWVCIAALTFIIIIGKFILLLGLIWYLVRVLKGIKYLKRQQPYPNPDSWRF